MTALSILAIVCTILIVVILFLTIWDRVDALRDSRNDLDEPTVGFSPRDHGPLTPVPEDAYPPDAVPLEPWGYAFGEHSSCRQLRRDGLPVPECCREVLVGK